MPHLPKPNGHDETLTPLPEAIRAQERSRRDRALNGEPDLVTEDSVALRFVEDYRDRLHYCHAFSYWYEWDGAIRRRHRTKYIFQLARELARELSQTQPDNVRSLMRSTSFVAGVARFARSDPAFAETAERWDKDPMLLGTPTGTVDLKTG